MMPVLYDANEVAFESNGLGRLSDVISCEVTEERNGKYELEMQYGVDGIHYSDIALSRIIFATPADGKSPQAFRIYKITKPINGKVTIYAEHISYQMNHIPVLPFTAPNCPTAFIALKNHAAEMCPFEFWTDKGADTSQFALDLPKAMRTVLGGESGSILNLYGGEFEWDNWTVKLWVNRGADKGVTIRYGKNLTDLKQEENIQATYTGICPYWLGSDENGNDELVTLPENVLHSQQAGNFPYQRTQVVDLSRSFDTKPTEEQLREEGLAYIERNNIGVPKVNLRVSFAALWQTMEYANTAAIERVGLCDTVTILFEKLGVSAKAKVIKTTYDVLAERYTRIEIGDAKANFADTIIRQNEETIEEAQSGIRGTVSSAISSATNKITGGLGGHVVINRNADGYPNEILIMDTEDKNTAVNVLRFNEAGIGFSQNGYNGPFNSAWTIDGTLDMQQINVIHLVADLIQGGTLTLGARENEAGVLQLYDKQNNLIGQMDKTGLKMYGVDGSYVLMNNEVGFAGYDRNNQKIYWVAADEFHMRKSVIEEEITLCDKMRFIPIEIYDSDDNLINDGIGLVSTE